MAKRQGAEGLCWEFENWRQPADYVHTPRQIVIKVQEAVDKSLCEGEPSYDEPELMEDKRFLEKGQNTYRVDYAPLFRRRWSGNLHIGGKWPTVDVDVIELELWAAQGSVADPEATSTEPAGSKEDPAAESSRGGSPFGRRQTKSIYKKPGH